MNILITGAFGFVGSNLSKALKTSIKHQLIAIDIKEPEKHDFNEFFSWNDSDFIDWSSIDTVIHLAGKAPRWCAIVSRSLLSHDTFVR